MLVKKGNNFEPILVGLDNQRRSHMVAADRTIRTTIESFNFLVKHL